MEHFIYPVLLDDEERYVIWFTNAVDGVLTRQDGLIATFSSVEAVRAFAQQRTLSVSEGISPTLDLRWVAQDSLTSGNLDCVQALNAWNFFVDVAASLPDQADSFTALDKRACATYEKVFWGNNLPSVTPHGEHFDPSWSEAEISRIKAILTSGLMLFRTNIDYER